jgi:hypothetical protein
MRFLYRVRNIACTAFSCRGDTGFPKAKARWRIHMMRLWRFNLDEHHIPFTVERPQGSG